jgi:flagellar biosynthesis chaperone FliJ
VRESKRYRELLDLREEEVDKLKAELSRLGDSAEELRGQVEQMERDNRALKASNRVIPKGMISNNSVQVAP